MATGTQGASPATRRRVTVIADDLTGATDTVVQFREANWKAYLLLTDEHPEEAIDETGPVATSRSLDTRPMPLAQAAERTHHAVAEQLAAGADRLYLKIDSTMRGSVAGQVTGALDAWAATHRQAMAVICPAYPQMGRIIVGGSMFVNGMALDQSAAGFDPVTPVSTALLTELLPGAVAVSNHGSPAELAGALATVADVSERVVVDAREDADLRRLAEAVDILGTRAVCVGSAGLARHLADVWRPAEAPRTEQDAVPAVNGTVLVSVSSLNEVSFDQIEHLAAAFGDRLERHEFNVEELQDPEGMRARGRDLAHPRDDGPEVIVVQPSPARVQGVDAAEAARSIAAGLAAAVNGMVSAGGIGAIVLVGGDGAQATLQELEAVALRVERQASEGVPLGRIVGGPAAGLPVVTKAGGFGSTTTMTDVITDLFHLGGMR